MGFSKLVAAWRTRAKAGFLLLIVAVGFPSAWPGEIKPEYYSVAVSATVQEDPPQIKFTWTGDPNAKQVTISRKSFKDSGWLLVADLPGNATSWVDENVRAGEPFEYLLHRTTSERYEGYGHIYAGLRAPPIESRGRILLLVDNLFSSDLAMELKRLESDLVGDGWVVARQDVSREATATEIKDVIRSLYAADPTNTKALFLFGHIPVPYSGNITPDEHPNHRGAWPADVYYADVDGQWTDHSIISTNAERAVNWNVPGDGKFDQSEIPSDVELQTGRVDLWNMTAFVNQRPSKNERDLLRQYLNKDHAWRHARVKIPRRALICNGVGLTLEDHVTASGWRNFAPFFGAAKVDLKATWDYFPILRTQGYLWSYASSGGSYYACDGVGSSDDFALYEAMVVFTMFLGSYFGDWNNESNFLRAHLGASSYILTSSYSGQPHSLYHHMALGETIGFGMRLSQNNGPGGIYPPFNPGSRQVHISLMGDPTLRLHPVIPPANLQSTNVEGTLKLSWMPSTDENLLGYYVYRKSGDQPTQRLNDLPVTTTSFEDTMPLENAAYMVRAVKLETSASGSYTNLSQGIFIASTAAPAVPAAPTSLSVAVVAGPAVTLTWVDQGGSEEGYLLERRNESEAEFKPLATLARDTVRFTDTNIAPGTTYTYQLRAFNATASSSELLQVIAIPREASQTNLPSVAYYIGSDANAQGDWKNTYGRDGFNIVGDLASLPAYVEVTNSYSSFYLWTSITEERRCLERASSDQRIAACWTSKDAFNIHLNFRDESFHRVTLYCYDFERAGRTQIIQFLDPATDKILSAQTISNFDTGLYVTWTVRGKIKIRVSPGNGKTPVVSGLFFDTEPALGLPTILPPGGSFRGGTPIRIVPASPAARVYYTLDGSTPGTHSSRFTAPFTLSRSATIKAIAMLEGNNPSAMASATFNIIPTDTPAAASAVFVKNDRSTFGSWSEVYGSDGYQVIAGAKALPPFVEVAANRHSEFIWKTTTTDFRAPQKSAGSGERVAACWTAPLTFNVDISLLDGLARRVALYFLDWGGNNRKQKVEILDYNSGEVLNTQLITDFNLGTYLVWDLKGRVRVRLSKLEGDNAVLMGIFFSAVDQGLPVPVKLINPTISEGELQFSVDGIIGQEFIIEWSPDCLHWTPLVTRRFSEPTFRYSTPIQRDDPRRFFRLR